MTVSVRVYALILAVLLFASGCGKKKVAAHPPAPAPKVGAAETGIASWYGNPYHGRAAADGEIYDMEKLTAAHRTLPFNTWVRVENLTNQQTVDVRIIDRGPFVAGRIIDISHAAAQQIGMIGTGTAKVRVVIIKQPAIAEASVFAVQVGLFKVRENADKLQAESKQRYGKARVVERMGSPPMWRVLVGEESSPEQAELLAQRVRGDISVPEAFVVRLDHP
jgi:rare lipoprotein A